MKGVTSAILFAFFFAIQHGSTVAYKAGVYEYYSQTSDTPLNTIRKNIEEYSIYADRAKSQSVDIMVFPEYGLTTIHADPEDYAVDLNDTTEGSIVVRLRDMAIQRQIYMVVNLLEKVQESNKATKYYNTNLVFGKNGTIILKYRKINLFNEDKLTPGDSDQDLTFTTDFGVTFGIFTCFDILFDNPSRRVLENNDVTDIVYPTAWYSTMPFFTSLTVQHGYALANGVNLLAANYGKPKESHGGSGIYLSNGKIAQAYIADSASSKPIIESVATGGKKEDRSVCPVITSYGLPTDTDKSNVTNYITKKDFDVSEYKFKSVDLSRRNSTIEVCDDDFCCTFDITVNTSSVGSTDKYKVVAFDGIVDLDEHNYHLRICSLLACEDDSNDSCGNRLNSTSTKFTKITVKGNLKKEEGTFYAPLTLNSYLTPLTNTIYCNNNNATNTSFVQLTTVQASDNVLVFGLLGKTVSAAASVHAFGLFVLVVFVMIKSAVF